MLKFATGNLLYAPEPVIAHGVNTAGVFGAGIAAQIAAKWPAAKSAYLERHRTTGWRLGDIQLVDVGPKTIAHLATQSSVGRRGRHVDYAAVRLALGRLLEQTPEAVALPKIGAGLGGGDWDRILEVIREVVPAGRRVTIYALGP